MTNRAIKKLLSLVLVMALVVSTVCGSVISVNAATADKTYTIVGDAEAAGTKTATMTVTITNPNGISSGSFDLMFGSDVIDDANFDTTTDENGKVTYNGYAENPDYETLAEFMGTKQETSEVTNIYDWDKLDESTAIQWATSDPDGSALEWQSTGSTREVDKYVEVNGSTTWATSDPDGDALVWQATGNSKTEDNWAETTVQLKLSEVPADTDTVKYVQGTKVQDNWTADYTQNFKYGERPDTSTGEWAYTNTTVQGDPTGEEKKTWSEPSDTDYYMYVARDFQIGDLTPVYLEYHKMYVYQHYSNDPTYNYTKRVNTPVTTYEYQEYKNTPYTETEYAKHVITYYEYVGGRDADGNNMITAVNTYGTREVDVLDEEGNPTGETTTERYLISTTTENSGNKGTLLPNAYDKTNGLWNTKIEITGGTLTDGTVVSADNISSYFTNENYKADTDLTGTTDHAIVGTMTDGTKYAYNITDDYYTTQNSKVTYVDTNIPEVDADGEQLVDDNGNLVWKQAPVINDEMLLRYYREYTTVDVATPNLAYAISTVSEDTVGQTPTYAQYAQGFKDITFNANASFSSITFTVTLDFNGTCDRISANAGVDAEALKNTVENVGYKYGNADGRYAAENYVGYGKKYQLNLVNQLGDIANVTSAGTNASSDYVHVCTGLITEAVGSADPLNKAAIDELLAKNPNAVEGEDYFKLYSSRCYLCNRTTPMLATYDMPYKVTDENGASVSNVGSGTYTFNNYRNISGVNLEYKYDGSVSLNIHYSHAMDGEQIIITDENGIALKYSDVIESGKAGSTSIVDTTSKYTATGSFYAAEKLENGKYDGLLLSDTKMITVEGFSASEADQKLYIARYTPKSSTETQLMGITHSISLVDYCNAVINDDNVYYLSQDNYSASNSDYDKMVAAAFINYAHASKTALSTPNDYKARDKVDVFEADSKGSFVDSSLKGSGTEADPYIVSTAEELNYVANYAGDSSKGMYYKVADGIKEFRMNADVTAETAYDTAIETLNAADVNWKNTAVFQGYFDGNGVIISGIRNEGSMTGLFAQISSNVTIKNVSITNSSFIGTSSGVAAIAGRYIDVKDSSGNVCAVSDLTFEKISVYNCYIKGTHSSHGAGAILGYAGNTYDSNGNESGGWVNGSINFNNCYINLTEDMLVSTAYDSGTANATHGGIAAYIGTATCYATDCVVIGIAPYTRRVITENPSKQNGGWQFARKAAFTDIYTTHTCNDGYSNAEATETALQDYTGRIFTITTEQLAGDAAKTNMPALDWDYTWNITDGYPELYTPYNTPTNVEKTIYWDGTIATGFAEGSGTKDDPYIINTAAELAYLVDRFDEDQIVDTDEKKAASSLNKYFKVADDIKNIVLQPEAYAADIMVLADAQAVKTYFEDHATSMKKWANEGWEQGAFCGTFDGNGATVYGLYQNSNSNAGLFTTVDAGATIKNIGVKNSYMKSSEVWNSTATNADNTTGRYDAYQVGAIAALSSGVTYGQMTSGVIWIDGCTVANNYMANNIVYSTTAHSRNGVIMGTSSDAVYVDNCLTYGNYATYGNLEGVTAVGNNSIAVAYTGSYEMAYLSSSGSNAKATDTNIVPEGLKTETSGTDTDGDPLYLNMVRNCVFLGTTPYSTVVGAQARFNTNNCCVNVYTDGADGKITFGDGGTRTYTLSQLQRVSLSEIKGLDAKSVMTELDWYDAQTNPDGNWYCSYLSAMPSLTPIDESLATLYPAYNIEFTEADADINRNSISLENGSMQFGVYTTALSLYSNPYLSFVFAFHGDYKTSRDQIKIKFVYTENGQECETAEITPPACEYDEDGNIQDLVWVNNWANVKASGRYHTYKATDIPVEALAYGITVMMSHPNVANGEYVNYGTYSAKGMGYAFDQLNTEESPSEYFAACAEAIRALVFYADAIKARYGAL